MGVLNVGDHLKHRRRIQETQSEEYLYDDINNVEEAPMEPPAQEKKDSYRQRKPKSKPQSYYNHNYHKPRGVRSGRRYENNCFLLSLVDHEEIGDLEVTDFVHTTMSIFASLFNDPNKMQIWNDFAELPEEDQELYLVALRGEHAPAVEGEGIDREVSTEDERGCDQQDLFAQADESFLQIGKKLRSTLHKRRFPIKTLEEIERDVITWFESCPDGVLISNLPSSLDRLLTHVVCQYLRLISNSFKYKGSHLVEVECRHHRFSVPGLTLSQYLERKDIR
ncbi:predicted protein [Nematostella vectensis]|uniref:R3H-associated N-terminal domain-containing protein n=1 Tax=Nematostella vectensis TaxID=45351 RepID=A7SMY3_NEMVE|nr:R3H domain-containing protein 4 [Nematostella vectensis]EDO34951.1 predicted protein [Nematostella vectensis]|eukprot:XP_001627051.1 predicted protein [Nematostella vectensis]